MIAPEYIQGNGFVAEVTRTARTKSATIKVEGGVVMVVVPETLVQDRIVRLLDDKARWIKEKLALHFHNHSKSDKQYVSEESFSYLGRNYRLKVNKGQYQPVKLFRGRFTVTLRIGRDNPELIQDSLTSWYKQHAQAKLTEKAKRYADIIGVTYASVGIKLYKSRWGSCSVDGNIDFNWHIIMAPNRIVDYVVVHELCHLIHHDHSPKFWKQVEGILPDYAESKEWLKLNADSLNI
jgi:predicted metal-dependent hydrolase